MPLQRKRPLTACGLWNGSEHFLWGRWFGPWTTLLATKGMGHAVVRIARWSTCLLCFNEDVFYKPGSKDFTTDCLSHLPLPTLEDAHSTSYPNMVALLLQSMTPFGWKQKHNVFMCASSNANEILLSAPFLKDGSAFTACAPDTPATTKLFLYCLLPLALTPFSALSFALVCPDVSLLCKILPVHSFVLHFFCVFPDCIFTSACSLFNLFVYWFGFVCLVGTICWFVTLFLPDHFY